jgi:hypothetical protein
MDLAQIDPTISKQNVSTTEVSSDGTGSAIFPQESSTAGLHLQFRPSASNAKQNDEARLPPPLSMPSLHEPGTLPPPRNSPA